MFLLLLPLLQTAVSDTESFASFPEDDGLKVMLKNQEVMFQTMFLQMNEKFDKERKERENHFEKERKEREHQFEKVREIEKRQHNEEMEKRDLECRQREDEMRQSIKQAQQEVQTVTRKCESSIGSLTQQIHDLKQTHEREERNFKQRLLQLEDENRSLRVENRKLRMIEDVRPSIENQGKIDVWLKAIEGRHTIDKGPIASLTFWRIWTEDLHTHLSIRTKEGGISVHVEDNQGRTLFIGTSAHNDKTLKLRNHFSVLSPRGILKTIHWSRN